MTSPLCELGDDLLLCIFCAVLTRLGPRGHAALESMSTACRVFRALRMDPRSVLRLCNAHGFTRRSRERFYPAPPSLCTTEGFYRRIVSKEYALHVDARFESAVVAGHTKRMYRLLEMGASVHTPDYALLKYVDWHDRRLDSSIRYMSCHVNGYESDESEQVTPLLERAAICGNAEVCALLLHVSGGLPTEKEPLEPRLHEWGVCRGPNVVSPVSVRERPRVMSERHELNDAAKAAYLISQFETLDFLLSVGAVVEPHSSHEDMMEGTVATNDVNGLRTLFSISSGSRIALIRLLQMAAGSGFAVVFRELLDHGATFIPRNYSLSDACARGYIGLVQELLPLLCASKDTEWDRVREMNEGLYMACRRLSREPLSVMRETLRHSTYISIANLMLDAGALPCASTQDVGERVSSTLVLACYAGNAPLVQRLLDVGAVPDEANGLPMKFASSENHVEVISVLNSAMVKVLNARLQTRYT